MSDLKIMDISKKYDDLVALREVSLDINNGEFFVVLGPTGAGKSTLLRTIAGLTTLDSGRIEMDGCDLSEETIAQRDVAFVFQQYSLYPNLTVKQNLEFPLKAPGRELSAEQISERVLSVAKTLRIEHRLEAKTQTLSGGEMQRVSIGRAIVRSPKLFLMDEPLSNLDAKLRESLRSELRALQRELNATIVLVTHDQTEALSLGDRVAVMNHGEVVQIGTPEDIYFNPKNAFVAELVGSPTINFLSGHEAKYVLIENKNPNNLPPLERTQREAAHPMIGVRPENLKIIPGKTFEIQAIENLGGEQVVFLSREKTNLRVVVESHHQIPVGTRCDVTTDDKDCIRFNSVTGEAINHQSITL
ncbi:ABC transporter ATP-binding protein [Vibrio sp. S9_S30]|uniref:ABC transporter ATP-binding protein n=1 Tax=Vibrio sp. S9_S30 TaxID=2720226 RepID=UPI00167FF9AD|nr:ABC transporter ATP-binding protein [Vibrio sp. S9_S30]MBD1556638.1 ABC transporter ATP-binding protein [Vibrio sp. S9_S30]